MSRGTRQRLTLTALGLALVAALVQYAAPAVVSVFQRDPEGLAAGEAWRLVTPLLVQTLGWHQVLANLVSLAVIGAIAEWLFARASWLLLIASGTLGGQVAAYSWKEPGGGYSIAICGLAGGILLALLVRRASAPWLAAGPTVLYVVALTGWAFGGPLMAGLGVVVAASLLYELSRLGVPGVERVGLAGAVVCAVVLTAAKDLHGASLVTGMIAAGLFTVGLANR